MYSIPSAVQLALKLVGGQIQKIKNIQPVIALDGHSSSGKSTLAKDLAELLGITHIDTGAMYRAVTLYLLENNIPIQNTSDVVSSLSDIKIDLKIVEGAQCTFLNDMDVSLGIRSMSVSDVVSEVSTISEVRRFLVAQQRQIATNQAVIMDGRDIGTVVLPEANVKLFVTASAEERSKRRHLELLGRGEKITIEEVTYNLLKRDKIDSEREDSPLSAAADAVMLDTTDLDRPGMLSSAIKIIAQKVNS